MIDDDELSELYQALVLEHSKKPFNFGTIEGISPIKGKNPACGDQIDLYVRLENQHIADIKFKGEGCALCIASSSLMTKKLKGKSINESKKVFDTFSRLLQGEVSSMKTEEYEVLNVFKKVHTFPSRVKCAMLGWRALETTFKNNENV